MRPAPRSTAATVPTVSQRRFYGLTHRHLTSYEAWLTVTRDALTVQPRFLSPWTVERHQTDDVAFRWRFLGSVLEVHPHDYRHVPLIVFRPLRRRPLEVALQAEGWLSPAQ